MSDGLMDMALAQDQAPDVGQGGQSWMAGWGSGSVCSGLAGLFVPLIQLPVCCLWMGCSVFPRCRL